MKLRNPRLLDKLCTQRISIIQKARTPLQVRIQMIHNKAVDERIFANFDEFDSMEGVTAPYYTEEVIRNEIRQLNFLATKQDFDRLLKNSFVNENHITQMEKINSSRKIGDALTNVEVERINKNLQYVDKTLAEAELDISKYKEIINKVPSQVSRKDILEKALTKGSNYKGREYSFKELNQLSRTLEKYRVNSVDMEKAKIENDQAQREGLGSLNQNKTWVWSMLEKTRHSDMDLQTVGLYEYFTVVNEITNDTDYLRFPQDIDNDSNNCSNICNCGCNYIITNPKMI